MEHARPMMRFLRHSIYRRKDEMMLREQRFWLEIPKWNLTEREQQGKFPRESHCTTIITIADWQRLFAGNFAQSADHDVTSTISQHFRRVRSWLGREQYCSGNLYVRTRVCHFVIAKKKAEYAHVYVARF